jgi:hypothetical protein
MREFFDHHLTGAAAPGWLLEGVPHIKMADHLEERAELVAPKAGNGGPGGGGRDGGLRR